MHAQMNIQTYNDKNNSTNELKETKNGSKTNMNSIQAMIKKKMENKYIL